MMMKHNIQRVIPYWRIAARRKAKEKRDLKIMIKHHVQIERRIIYWKIATKRKANENRDLKMMIKHNVQRLITY